MSDAGIGEALFRFYFPLIGIHIGITVFFIGLASGAERIGDFDLFEV